jgi:hypothetical protein
LSVSLRFPNQNPLYTSPIPILATCLAYLTLLDFTTRTIVGEECRLFSSLLCTFLHSPLTSSLFDPNILFSTIFSNTLSLLS